MTNTSALDGYDPRCSIYPKKERNGKVSFYISYFLPTGIRMMRPGSKKRSEAKRLMHLKERELLEGKFDDKDWQKMPHLQIFDQDGQERWQLDAALELYLTKTEAKRKPNSQYKDRKVLEMMFVRLGKQVQFLDEVKPLIVQNLFDEFVKEGKAPATLKTYTRTISKVFKWFIDDMELLEMRNPVRKLTLPKPRQRGYQNALVRDHIPTPQEVRLLLAATEEVNPRSRCPVNEIVKFLIFTGARLGEALHAEFSDFDLERGIWYIRYKPKCPTFHGMGWSPKWDKERDVFLMPEALELVRSLPRFNKVFGKIPVRDEKGKIIDHQFKPASFLFPKREIWKEKGKRSTCFTRVDDIDRSWYGLREKAGVYNLQLKDLRTYFNWILVNHYHLSHKEAGSYIGNSEVINHRHYSPVVETILREKIEQQSLSKIIGVSKQ